jgi:hypothetical protein
VPYQRDPRNQALSHGRGLAPPPSNTHSRLIAADPSFGCLCAASACRTRAQRVTPQTSAWTATGHPPARGCPVHAHDERTFVAMQNVPHRSASGLQDAPASPVRPVAYGTELRALDAATAQARELCAPFPGRAVRAALEPGCPSFSSLLPSLSSAVTPSPWQCAKHVSALLDPAATPRALRRHVRYAQRAVLWQMSSLKRVRNCGRVRSRPRRVKGRDGEMSTVAGDALVAVLLKEGVGHFRGLQSCGSVHACTVCCPKVLNGRALEISLGAGAWQLDGNTVAMATFTFPHDYGMALKPLLPLVADGFRSVISGRPWRRLKARLGLVGDIRAFECTHGCCGWHPHLHVLFFAEGELGAAGVVDLTVYLREKWAGWITGQVAEDGQHYRVPHDTKGVDVQICKSGEDAGLYIAKTDAGRSVGNEIARGDMKQGRKGSRTPFQILDDHRWTGDLEDRALWHEWEQATKGHQRITFSKNLRQILGAAAKRVGVDLAPEMSDEELAAAEVGGELVAEIPAEVWARVVMVPALDAAVLDAAERGGLDGINELLGKHGCGRAEAPLRERGS